MITKEKSRKMEYLICFGSLKQNKYNFNRFGGQTFIKSFEIDKYEMYDLGFYPAVCPGEGKITVELHSVEPTSMKYIRSMERGAGYNEDLLDIDLDNATVKASIFTMPKKDLINYDRISNGNWQ